MIASLLRSALLRVASEYLSNVDINKLSLWSGHIALQNVKLNASAITKSLNLPYIRMISGDINSIELSIPWTSLSSRSVQLKLSQVFIEISLSENTVVNNPIQPVSESEETLLSKIIGNLDLEIQDLTVLIRWREEALYIGQLNLDKLKLYTTNENWEEEFLNPFVQVPGGAGYRVWRKIEFTDMNFRIVSGSPDDTVSEIILMHKFEKVKCWGCPLCHGFKSSSLYSLCTVRCQDFVLQSYIASEHSISHYKSHNAQLIKDLSTQQLKFLLAPLQVKLNLKNDTMFMRDFYGLLSKSTPPPVLAENKEDSYSWWSWGRDFLLSPFYCSDAINHHSHTEKLTVDSFLVSIQSPSLHIRSKIHNPDELEVTRFNLTTGEFKSEARTNYSESSEGTIPKQCEKVTEGTIMCPLLSCHLKNDYVVFRTSDANFSMINDKVDYLARELIVHAFLSGNKASSDACRSSRLCGSIVFGNDLFMNINTDPLSLGFSLEEMMIIIQIILEAKSFYTRISNPISPIEPLRQEGTASLNKGVA